MQIFLKENWFLRKKNTAAQLDEWNPADVPGSVYTQLLQEGKTPDPYWKDQEDEVCESMKDEYEYQCLFDYPEYGTCHDQVILRMDGVDTLSDIYLNDIFLGKTDNMHRIWEFEVGTHLKEKQNVLHVVLHSPLPYIAKANEKYHTLGNEDTFAGFMHLRKAHYMFGWDWGAHLPDMGIFRPVSLITVDKARIDEMYIHQIHENGEVWIEPQIRVKTVACQDRDAYGIVDENDSFHYEVILTDPCGEKRNLINSPQRIKIEDARLWWPNELGEQPLYQVEVILFDRENHVLDTKCKRIGLRTLTMERKKDQWGESFAHKVNGMCVFAMGADYIPEDHLLGRTNRERTRKLLEDCKAAHFNTIRVWGGGYYPEDWFFDLCDELGLMIWQDFMFACSVYELTEEFEANITEEFRDNIRRIANHPSLALWCGNNEMEMFVQERCWVSKESEVRDYLFMYERIIPKILKRYDPDTFYWPASPSSGGSFDEPNDPNRGDVHYWQVWHGNKPFTEYRKHFFRYASEFGFQAFPAKKTIETFTDDPKEWNPFSYVVEKHQRNYGANGKIMNYLQQTYLYPENFERFIYASQLLQGEAIRYGVEHFRRNRGRCMGTIYWQLNDCWPVISWSSIDYHGRWKALHYYAKRFFAPLLLSCEEEGMLSAEVNLNRQNPYYEKSFRLNVSNETRDKQNVQVAWQLRNASGEILNAQQEKVFVEPLDTVWLPKITLNEMDVFIQYISYQLLEDEQQISEGTALLTYPKYFKFQNPNLSYRVEGNEIIIHADAYAKNVEIQNTNEDLILSDNYFDMNPGEKRIQIIRGEADRIHLQSVFNTVA